MTPWPVRRSRGDGESNPVPARITEPRIVTIDGRPVLEFTRQPPLPSTLHGLLGQLRVTFRADVRPTGARASCEVPEVVGGVPRDHRLVRFREGRHVGLDGVVRDLRLFMCADCEAVDVRDVSWEEVWHTVRGRARLLPRRRDDHMGWYTGARRNQRVYHQMATGAPR